MKRHKLSDLVRREVVLHLHDGVTSIRGFIMEFYDDALLIAKPALEAPDAKDSTALAGEALVFRSEIKFVQVLGG